LPVFLGLAGGIGTGTGLSFIKAFSVEKLVAGRNAGSLGSFREILVVLLRMRKMRI
jgi:hypothetical protein